MENSLIEKFVIDEITKTREENTKLKEENKKLKEEINNTSSNISGNVKIGVVWTINAYDYYINDENINEYKKALENKDFNWLENRGFSINENDYNYVIDYGNKKAFLNIYMYKNQIQVKDISYDKNKYFSIEEAQDEMLALLKKYILNKENKEENKDD